MRICVSMHEVRVDPQSFTVKKRPYSGEPWQGVLVLFA